LPRGRSMMRATRVMCSMACAGRVCVRACACRCAQTSQVFGSNALQYMFVYTYEWECASARARALAAQDRMCAWCPRDAGNFEAALTARWCKEYPCTQARPQQGAAALETSYASLCLCLPPACVGPAWGLCGSCVGPAWVLCGACVGPVWVSCVGPVWSLCVGLRGSCVGPVWVSCVGPVWGLFA